MMARSLEIKVVQKVWDVSLNNTSDYKEEESLAAWFFCWYVKIKFWVPGTHFSWKQHVVIGLLVSPVGADKELAPCTVSVLFWVFFLFLPFLF